MEDSDSQHSHEIVKMPETLEEVEGLLQTVHSYLDNLRITSPAIAGTVDDGFHYIPQKRGSEEDEPIAT